MIVTTLTALAVATLPVGGHVDGQVDGSPYIERTAVDQWRFRTADHDVTLHRRARTWQIDDDHVPVGTAPALFNAVNLAFATL